MLFRASADTLGQIGRPGLASCVASASVRTAQELAYPGSSSSILFLVAMLSWDKASQNRFPHLQSRVHCLYF